MTIHLKLSGVGNFAAYLFLLVVDSSNYRPGSVIAARRFCVGRFTYSSTADYRAAALSIPRLRGEYITVVAGGLSSQKERPGDRSPGQSFYSSCWRGGPEDPSRFLVYSNSLMMFLMMPNRTSSSTSEPSRSSTSFSTSVPKASVCALNEASSPASSPAIISAR